MTRWKDFKFHICHKMHMYCDNNVGIKNLVGSFLKNLGYTITISSDFDALQAILASDFAKKDFDKASATASRVLQVLNYFQNFFFFEQFCLESRREKKNCSWDWFWG